MKLFKFPTVLISLVIALSAIATGFKQSKPVLATNSVDLLATDPELVYSSNFAKQYLVGHGFVYEIGAGCSVTSPPFIKRRPINGTNTAVALVLPFGSCDAIQEPVISSEGIYYHNVDRDQIEFVPVGSSSSLPLTIAPTDPDARRIKEIMVSSHSVIWVEYKATGEFSGVDTIKKVAKDDSDSVRTIYSGPGFSNRDYILHQSHIWWISQNKVTYFGVNPPICFGGPCEPEQLDYDASSLFLADNNELYFVWTLFTAFPFSTLSSDLYRLDCTSSFNIPIGSFVIGSCDRNLRHSAENSIEYVNNTLNILYWAEEGSNGLNLRRKVGSSALGDTIVEDISDTLNLLEIDSTHVYFQENETTVDRLPHDAEAIQRQFSIAGMEVTQGIQNLNNEVPLVAGKTTYVRLYPQLDDGETINHLQAELHGSRDGVTLPGSPLVPINHSLEVDTNLSIAERADLDSGFLFRLPPTWVSEDDLDIPQLDTTIMLIGEVDPMSFYAGTDNASNNRITEEVTFVAKAPTCMTLREVWTKDNKLSPFDPSVAKTMEIAESMLPTANLIVAPKNDRLEETNWCWKSKKKYGVTIKYYGPFCSSPYELTQQSYRVHEKTWILNKLAQIDFYEDVPNTCVPNNARTMAGGVVEPNANWGGTKGVARSNFVGNALFMKIPAINQPNYLELAQTTPHEIGHIYGRKHINCGGPDKPDFNYPYAPCMLDDGQLGDKDTHFGFDSLNEFSIHPTSTVPMMSYEDPSWTSDYTWKAIFNGTLDPSTNLIFPRGIRANSKNVLILDGVVNQIENEGILNYGFVYPLDLTSAGLRTKWTRVENSGWTRASESTVHLQLMDSNERVLNDIEIEQVDVLDHLTDDFSFIVSIDLPSETVSKIQLMNGDQVIASRDINQGIPTLKLNNPVQNQFVQDELSIEWEATDPDGDQLQYLIQYSYDDGEHWNPLITNYYGDDEEELQSIILDMSAEPGSNGNNALIRVLASDGYNTAIATSEPFTVETKKPTVAIVSPAENEMFTVSEAIKLQGFATDPEDLYIKHNKFSWTFGGETVLGEEGEIVGLAPGTHVINLEVEDEDGNTGTTSSIVKVAPYAIAEAEAELVFDGSCDDAGYSNLDRLPVSSQSGGTRSVSQFVHDNNFMWVCTNGISTSNNQSTIYLDFSTDSSTAVGETVKRIAFKVDGSIRLEEANTDGSWSIVNLSDIESRLIETTSSWSSEIKIPRAIFGDWTRRFSLMVEQTSESESQTYKWPLGSDNGDPSTWGMVNLGLISAVDSLTPSNAVVNSPTLSLEIKGGGFTEDHQVYWGNTRLETTIVDSNTINTILPSSFLKDAGVFEVTISIDGAEGLRTTPAYFTVENKAPQLISLTPNEVEYGIEAVTVQISGSDFTSESVVYWAGEQRNSTFINSTQLRLELSAVDLEATAFADVVVRNPSPGGGASNSLIFDIFNPDDPDRPNSACSSGQFCIYLPMIQR